ncbi:hypothetical protein, partial [Acidisphaera sp. S103]|uniref:hypothetical protein n=1 Tax=Acidisphaera sp. S103 TaxID=1747223 RepID=UPI001C204567
MADDDGTRLHIVRHQATHAVFQEAARTFRPTRDRTIFGTETGASPTCFDGTGFHHATGLGSAFLGTAVPARVAFFTGAAFPPTAFNTGAAFFRVVAGAFFAAGGATTPP